MERTAIVSRGQFAIRFARRRARLLGHYENERVVPRVVGFNAMQARVGRLG